MSTFTDFTNILPDPNNSISYDGSSTHANPGSSFGPGYASVSLQSKQPYLRDITNSGKLLARTAVSHKWETSIQYNPMTKADFSPVYTFLLSRFGPMNPFFVSLPQHRVPQSSSFATWSNLGATTLESAGAYSAGETSMLVQNGTFAPESSSGTPLPGDLFNLDASDSNHNKAYMVTRVETASNYLSGTTQPSSTQVRIHFTPALQKNTVVGDDLVFYNPLIKVVLNSDVQEYSLNTQNLYSFSLKLEEVQ